MRRRWLMGLLAVSLAMLVGLEGRGDDAGAGTGRVVRVAFCAERGMCYRMDNGAREGVVPAWMWRLAARRNWKVEWVELSYQDGLSQVAEGKVDIMGGIRKDAVEDGELLFSAMPMGLRRDFVYVLASSPFQPSDLKMLKNCKIGMVKGCVRPDLLMAFLATRGVQGVTWVAYGDACKLERALFSGEVGAVVSDVTEHLADERELMSVGTSSCYFATSVKNRALMAEIDTAMHEIAEGEPGLARDLRSAHFPVTHEHGLELTAAERAWIARRIREGGTISVDISPADPPFKIYDAFTGRVGGNFGEMLDEVSEMTGLVFEPLPPASAKEGTERFLNGKTDIWLPFANEEPPEILKKFTPVMINLPDACCTRRYGVRRDESDSRSRASVWSGDHARLAAYARLGYLSRLVICDSREDCVRVVADGRADMTFFPYDAVRRLIARMELQDRMDVRIVNSQRYEPKIPMYLNPKADPVFASIIQKSVMAISRDRMIDMIHRAEARENVSPRLTREQKALWGGVPILAALLLLLSIAIISRRRVASALHRSEMSLRVADDALREATTAREQMREALDRAEFAARSKANFLATMSHEIRTPLNAVIGFSEFLGEPNLPLAKVQEYANGISFSANSLLSLLNDILDISKFESGRTEGLDMRTGASDVAALFREMESVFRMKGQEKQIDVMFGCDGDIPRLKLFEPRLRQILLNLVGNAVKFTDHGGVVVMASYRGGRFRLEVKDTGIGISPRGLKLVFDPFSQDMESRSGKVYAGTGLGLSIVKRLVEASGGKVQVSSEIGKGSSFVVELPGIEVLPAQDGGSAAAEAAVFVAKFRRVVIVDDTKMNCRLLEAFCRKLGVHEVRSFASGAEALAHFEAGAEADVVLSDLWMPGMNGSELARKLSERWPSLPVVAVTADTDAGATFDMEFFRAIIAKPVTLQKLRELLVNLAACN